MTVFASVAIPTYKRSACVLDALRSVIAQQSDHIYEVLVLDNGCDPDLQTKVEWTARQAPVPVGYISVPEIGLHNARHAAVRKANSDILVFVDDDIIADQGWLQAIVDAFDDPDVHLVGGRNLPRYETEPPDWLEALWAHNSDGLSYCSYLSLLDYGEQRREIDPNLIWGLNFSIRKKTLVSLGGFHPDSVPWELRRYRGDGETAVSLEAKRRGLKAVYQPKALVYHKIPESRMTVEYLERRSYLQGISDSYTRIRLEHGLATSEVADRQFDWKLPLRKLKRVVGRRLRSAPPDSSQEIKFRVSQAHEAGYKFHQDEVRHDPELLRWVLKEDYWDGRLPGSQQQGQNRMP